MKILTEYRGLKVHQLVRNQGTLAIIQNITIDEVLEEKFPEKNYGLFRLTLLDTNGIPFADTTQPIELIESLCLKDTKDIKTKEIAVSTEERPKYLVINCNYPIAFCSDKEAFLEDLDEEEREDTDFIDVIDGKID